MRLTILIAACAMLAPAAAHATSVSHASSPHVSAPHVSAPHVSAPTVHAAPVVHEAAVARPSTVTRTVAVRTAPTMVRTTTRSVVRTRTVTRDAGMRRMTGYPGVMPIWWPHAYMPYGQSSYDRYVRDCRAVPKPRRTRECHRVLMERGIDD